MKFRIPNDEFPRKYFLLGDRADDGLIRTYNIWSTRYISSDNIISGRIYNEI